MKTSLRDNSHLPTKSLSCKKSEDAMLDYMYMYAMVISFLPIL